MARATSSTDLQNLIGARIARSSGLDSWVLPYVIFTLSSKPVLTMRAGEDLTLSSVEANLYAASGAGLDELEGAWHRLFHKRRWVPAGSSETIKSWITSVYDDSIKSLEVDTQARAYLRVIETEFAFIPA